MADFPAIPLWTDAYLADTRHLTTLEHGAYLLLLMEAWRRPTRTLPDDDKLLARLAGLSADEWADVREVIMAFWKRDGRSRTWSQKRLSLEATYVLNKSRSQRDKAAKRWNNTEKQDAAAMPERCPDDAPTPTPTPTPHIEDKPLHGGRASRLPADFAPVLTPSARSTTSAWPAGMLERELAQFKDNATAKGLTFKDWQAAFRTWISNAEKWKGRSNGRNDRSQSGHGVTIDAAQDWINGQ